MTEPQDKELQAEGKPEEGAQEVERAELEDVESLKRALDEERAKAESYLANWQRAQADLINLKRRSEQEREEVIKFANATLVSNLLPVIDDLERALDNVSEKLAGLTWVDGVRLIYRKLLAILEGHGLTEIKALGEKFDPRLHEAVLFGDGEEGEVIQELQKGYKLHNRVIRPSMVKVGSGPLQKEESKEGKSVERESREA